jgi:hypothetical protein
LARWLLKQRTEDDGSREAVVTRALMAIVEDGNRTTTTSLALSMVKKHYAEENGEPLDTASGKDRASKNEPTTPFGLDTAAKLGKLFKRMNVPKLPRTSKGNIYDLSESVMRRLMALYLPEPVPSIPDNSTLCTEPAHPTPPMPDTSAGYAGHAGSVGSWGEVQNAIPDWFAEFKDEAAGDG